ncbi:RNI-like protein [Lanmaoa asiatica]|nr:RNI-like protein [Lanmaoa asiatica]
MSSKFREHLSVNTFPKNLEVPLEISRFSPSSTIAPSSGFLFGRSNLKHPKPLKPPMPTIKDIEAGIEAGTPPTSPSLRGRFTQRFFDLRTSNTAKPDSVPVQDHLTQWPPLNIEKHRCPCQLHDPKDMRKQRRRSRCLLILLILILLFLIGNVTYLNVRVVSFSTSSSVTQTISQSASTASALSVDAQQCLSQYTLNAPSSPSSYPCSTCLSTLQAVPSSYTSSSANSQNTQVINNAIQFCGLRAVYETVNAQGQATLGNGSWASNVNFCTWTGVSCDTSGLVASLQLTYPGVPATLPNEIGGLTTLQTLEVIGGNSTPAGSLPSSFTNLTSLTNLHLEATSITALPNSLFASPGLTGLATLTLVRNSQMGAALPSSLTGLTGLQNLVINSQALSSFALETVIASSSLATSLHTLDFTSTSLTGSIPSAMSSFKGLTQLLLGSNNLTGAVPTFPSTLQVLELGGNGRLGGSISCTPGSLQQCSVQGTTISVAGCGVCQNTTTTTGR